MNPEGVDKRISQEQLSISFSLKLPLSLYDTSTGMVVEELWKRSARKAERKGAVRVVNSLDIQKVDQDMYESVHKALLGPNPKRNFSTTL